MSAGQLRAFYIGLQVPEPVLSRRTDAEPSRLSASSSTEIPELSKPVALSSKEAAAALTVLLKHHKQLHDDIIRAATF
jgi:hypothetical protein